MSLDGIADCAARRGPLLPAGIAADAGVTKRFCPPAGLVDGRHPALFRGPSALLSALAGYLL